MEHSNMPKKRNPENKGLPARWQYKHGAYYYHVPSTQKEKWDGKTQFRLGKTLHEAYGEWTKRLDVLDEITTVSGLLDRYALEVVPTKQIATQSYYGMYMKKLRAVFGEMRVSDIEPVHIYKYVDKRSKKVTNGKKTTGGLSIAKREVSMFSDVYTHAIKWGCIKKHPFKGELKLDSESERNRYVENWELGEFLSLKPNSKKDTTLVLQAYTSFKLISGLRQQDILSMKMEQIKEDGIHVTPLKTKKSSGKSIIIEWTPKLRLAIDALIAARPVDISPFVVCTRKGLSYYDHNKPQAASGWKSIWRRYMDRVLKETSLKERFTEHDLRAKTASDLDDIPHAQRLLAHSSEKMTRRYIRKPQRVMPAN